MAVKKHGLVTDNHNQLDLKTLVQYIQMMNDQPGYLPPPTELVKNCRDIVKCLARSSVEEVRRLDVLKPIELFLTRVIKTVRAELRAEITAAVLERFYSSISDPKCKANAATSTVLVVLDLSNPEQTMTTVRWLVQRGDSGPAEAGLRASLSCLYSWLTDPHCHVVLGGWVTAFITALEENGRFDLLTEVSMDNLEAMFCTLERPVVLPQPIADVIFHVLASLRHSAEAFDKISNHVGRVLTNMASDSSQFSRQLLQNTVELLSSTVVYLVSSHRGANRENVTTFRVKYAEVILVLESHMAYRSCQLLNTTPWPTRKKPTATVATNPRVRKVGLSNIGNICYMNSVMQALLCTRRFSTHVMLRMNRHPYWAKLAMLFSRMTHSMALKLNPLEFYKLLRPPFFLSEKQHDSSELLGYIFELLQSYEHIIDDNYDYSKPPVLSTTNRWRVATQSYTSASSDNESVASGSSRRSVSPRPGGSGGGSSPRGTKRLAGDEAPVPRKRQRTRELLILRSESHIDSMFGGVLLTRVECVHCHSASISRDVFRDLQLAFPEVPPGSTNEKYNKRMYDVQHLLQYYCSKETLTGDNQYHCRDCGVLRDAERSVIIETTPTYLVLVLKHFKFDPKHQDQMKLMHSVFYNPTITLPTYRSEASHSSYNLYAAVVHEGTTLDSGHYFTIAKDNGAWYVYNDEEVTVGTEASIHELSAYKTPYLLFYRRTDVEEDTAPPVEDLPPTIAEAICTHNSRGAHDAKWGFTRAS